MCYNYYMKGYTTVEKIEDYLLISIDSSFVDTVEGWIADIEEYMDHHTDRVLGVEDDAEASEYIYDGTGKTELMIDDFIEIDSVTLNDDDSDITESVFFHPANKKPIWKLQTKGLVFTKDIQNVKVTGIKGYALMANFPKDLTLAATVIVSGIINQQKPAAQADVSSETIGRYTVTYTTDLQRKQYHNALETLKRYKRIR